jgi:hypothetical protein
MGPAGGFALKEKRKQQAITCSRDQVPTLDDCIVVSSKCNANGENGRNTLLIIQTRSTDFTVKKIEVFNIADERIRLTTREQCLNRHVLQEIAKNASGTTEMTDSYQKSSVLCLH